MPSDFARHALASASLVTAIRPLPNSYWATPLLLATEYPWCPQMAQAPKLDNLLMSGARTFIDLTEDGELCPYAPHLRSRAIVQEIDPSEIEYHQFPIRDRNLPESLEQVSAILDVLRDNERRGRISVVHCRGGIGRTGTIVGCWLIQSGLVPNGSEALSVIAREWRTVQKADRYPHSPETGPQCEFVLNYRPIMSSAMTTCS